MPLPRRSSSRPSRSCLSDDAGALLVVAEAAAIVEAIPEAEAELEPRPEPAPEIIPLPTTVVAATVDVGANSAHLLVAAVTGHLVEPLLDESAFLGLGDRVATHGYLGADARDELVATLAGYADAARSLGASSVTIVGTEPMRRAADAAPLIHAVEGAGQRAAPRPRPRRGGPSSRSSA